MGPRNTRHEVEHDMPNETPAARFLQRNTGALATSAPSARKSKAPLFASRQISKPFGPLITSERGGAMTPVSIVNWFASAYKLKRSDERVASLRRVDFNQGVDARILCKDRIYLRNSFATFSALAPCAPPSRILFSVSVTGSSLSQRKRTTTGV